MIKKWIAVIMIAALTCTLFACTTSNEESSSSQTESSSSTVDSFSEPDASSDTSEEETTTPSDGETSQGEPSNTPSSTTPTVDNTNAGQGANSKKYTQTDENFTFQDGVYKRIYGNRAMFVVTKDPTNLSNKELNDLSEATAGQYLKDDYYCTVCFVKPDNADGTFDITSTKSDDRTAVIMSLHKSDSTKMTINLKERPLQEYIDKQVAKAKVSS